MDDQEYEEVVTAIMFWRGALSHQYTPETQSFARAQIARLEKRAAEEAIDLMEEGCGSDCACRRLGLWGGDQCR